jgi:hypothetical protein
MTALWNLIVSKVIGAKVYIIAIGAALLTGLALLAKFAADNRKQGRLEEQAKANKAAKEAVGVHNEVEQSVDRLPDSVVRQRLRDNWRQRG